MVPLRPNPGLPRSSAPLVGMGSHSLISAMLGCVWSVQPDHIYFPLRGLLSAHELPEPIGAQEARTTRIRRTALLSINGTLTNDPLIAAFFGGTVISQLRDQFTSLVADDSIRNIVLDINSPGGTIPGIPELAADILEARESKTIIASVNSRAASAAYWLASQATEITITPGGMAGSVGTFVLHTEFSKLLEDMGVKGTIVRSPDGKARVNPVEPLSDEARASLQDAVDELTEDFQTAVSTGRNVAFATVRKDFVQVVTPRQAQAFGIVDRIEPLDRTLSRLSGGNASVGAAAEDVTDIRSFEHFLRDAGFGSSRAKAIASAGWKSSKQQSTNRIIRDGAPAVDGEVLAALDRLKRAITNRNTVA